MSTGTDTGIVPCALQKLWATCLQPFDNPYFVAAIDKALGGEHLGVPPLDSARGQHRVVGFLQLQGKSSAAQTGLLVTDRDSISLP